MVHLEPLEQGGKSRGYYKKFSVAFWLAWAEKEVSATRAEWARVETGKDLCPLGQELGRFMYNVDEPGSLGKRREVNLTRQTKRSSGGLRYSDV